MIINNKYLRDLGLTKENFPQEWTPNSLLMEAWEVQQKELGFDERDLWDLNYAAALEIYPRLMFYREKYAAAVKECGTLYEIDELELDLEDALNLTIFKFECELLNERYRGCSAVESLAVIMEGLWDRG